MNQKDDAAGARPIDCQIFADQLDALVREELPEEGMRQLHLHAEACAECGVQLQLQEHLVRPSLEELETRVPEEMVVGMWDAVRSVLVEGEGKAALGVVGTPVREDLSPRQTADPGKTAGSTRSEAPEGLTHPRFRKRASWLVPTLAAASLVLFFSTGFLYWQTTRLQTRAEALAQQVEDQRYWMSELEVGGSDPVARTAALAGRSPWSRALYRQDEISLAGLRDLLARAPGDRVILTRAQVDGVLRSRVPLSPSILREALARISGTDGVTAAELLDALDGMGMSPDTTVPTAELIALVS